LLRIAASAVGCPCSLLGKAFDAAKFEINLVGIQESLVTHDPEQVDTIFCVFLGVTKDDGCYDGGLDKYV
jgi:hypothetical protein